MKDLNIVLKVEMKKLSQMDRFVANGRLSVKYSWKNKKPKKFHYFW